MIEPEQVALRPVQAADENFLLAVYASTRADELKHVPWSAEQKDAFVRMQFAAQQQHYAAENPQAQHDIILLQGTAVGRLYLDRGEDEFHILDITVLPQHRNQGVGSHLLGWLLHEAGKLGKPVTIYVESFNPSMRLFERLGFLKEREKGFHCLMRWQAQHSS
ncbi:MAG: GNAT family N-acetyltransferase [Candidatus Angelobacter sp.]